ncbi:MAG: DNA repair protein RecN [SAR324 cluster bacterium]|nr:DNA repair protein RecN [SAR324 cluster bacterium]
MEDQNRPVLTRLTIHNLATIESLTLELEGGFTVLTGETGAGKSILIEAIRFVLGEKSSPHHIRTGTRRTMVEAIFDMTSLPEVRRLLNEMEIPGDGELTLRRMLAENGRSRAVANDCAITQTRLETLGGFLVNIHGQQDHQMLLDPATHLEFLDAFGGLVPLRGEVAGAHGEYTGLLTRRKTLREQQAEGERRLDELTAMVSDLKAANLSPGEDGALQRELALLANSENLTRLLSEACEALDEGDAPILQRLGEVTRWIEEAAALDERLRPFTDQLGPMRFQLDDLHRSLRSHAAALEPDPNRLDAIHARLAELEKIKRVHGNDLSIALADLEAGERELAERESDDDALRTLDEEIGKVAGKLHDLSGNLSRQRHESGTRLNGFIISQLEALGMEKAVFEIRLEPLRNADGKTPSYAPTGMDSGEFMLSTNPGQDLRPLRRIASGGELSRTMLAMKSVLAKTDPTKTLIFDEVDAGISGKISQIVGQKLRELGETHQVLCVTHQPQIAALGTRHVLVSKATEKGQTYTRAETLEGPEKVKEVARLLSGIDITTHSLASAEEMLSQGENAGG